MKKIVTLLTLSSAYINISAQNTPNISQCIQQTTNKNSKKLFNLISKAEQAYANILQKNPTHKEYLLFIKLYKEVLTLYFIIRAEEIHNEEEKNISKLVAEDMKHIKEKISILKKKLTDVFSAATRMIMRDTLKSLKKSQQQRWASCACDCSSSISCEVKEHEREDDEIQLLTYAFPE